VTTNSPSGDLSRTECRETGSRIRGSLRLAAASAIAVAAVAAVAAGAQRQLSFSELIQRAETGDLSALRRSPLGRYTPGERLLLQARLDLSQLNSSAARGSLERYAQLREANAEHLLEYHSLHQDVDMLEADYDSAARHGEAWERVPGAPQLADFAGHHQGTVMARQLSAVPPVRVAGDVQHRTVPATKDKAGLTRIAISIGGHPQDAVVDTGASFSAMSASAAKRFELRMIEGSASLASSTRDSVDTRLAVADQVEIAGTRFNSVVFLVMADDQLEFPLAGGYKIDAIVGFPELYRLGRLRFAQHTVRVESTSEASPAKGNLVLAGNKLYVAADLGGVCVPLYLDTGSNKSFLTALFARVHPDLIRALTPVKGQLGGAGGTTNLDLLDWRDVPVTLGQHRMTLASLHVQRTEPTADSRKFGTLGRDVLDRGYSLDFRSMQLELDGEVSRRTSACAAGAAE
jgi:predicted aspartyl protease